MKKLIFCILLISPVALLVHSCKPEPGPEPDPVFTPLPQDIKDYCIFKYGSYWIYQDSISGAFDTVTVETYTFDTVNYILDGKVRSTNETFAIKLLHSHDGFFDDIRLFALPPPPQINPNGRFLISLERFKPGQVLGLTIYHLNPIILNKPEEIYNDTVTLVSRTADEMHYHHGRYPGYDYSSIENYHRRNIGIYRREVQKKNQIWKLIKYNVNQ